MNGHMRSETGELSRESLPASSALDPAAFYSLYLGGLAFSDRQRRARSTAILLLSGRLGLRPGEIQHLHEGWIDWNRGVIQVPQRDPCACDICYQTARYLQRTGDGRQVLDILSESTWSSAGRARTIPFGWSQRLTAVLGMICESEGYLGLSAEAMARLINRSAHQAEGLDYTAVDVRSLRSTAAVFFADAGFSAHRIAELLGEDVERTAVFARREGGDAREHLFEQFTESTVADPGEAYGLVGEPEPFEHEPFDPRTYDADWRQARGRQQTNQPDSLRNPRPVTSSVDGSFDVADLGSRSYLDPGSELVDDEQTTTTLQQWVARREAQRYNGETASMASDQPTHEAAGSASGGQTATESQSTAEAESPTVTQSGSVEMDSESGSTDPESGPHEETASIDSGGLLDPRDRISGDPILTTETTVACSGLADGQPVPCHVVLAKTELLVVRADDTMSDEHTSIPVPSIVDLATNHIPSQFEDTFDSTVAIAYDEDDNRQLAVLELRGNKQIGFSNELFKLALRYCEAVVTHPAKEGGRVLDTEPVQSELSIDDRSLSVTSVENDEEFSIRLSDIIHLEMGKQTYEKLRLRSLSVRHLDEDQTAAETAIKLRNDRKHKLFERFVRQSYRKRKQKTQQLTIPEEHQEVLVALYSVSAEMDISMIINKSAEELESILSSLQNVGLIRMGKKGAVLTGLGRIVVNEQIEDVNT